MQFFFKHLKIIRRFMIQSYSFPLRKNCEALLEYHVLGIERSKSIDLEKKKYFHTEGKIQDDVAINTRTVL